MHAKLHCDDCISRQLVKDDIHFRATDLQIMVFQEELVWGGIKFVAEGPVAGSTGKYRPLFLPVNNIQSLWGMWKWLRLFWQMHLSLCFVVQYGTRETLVQSCTAIIYWWFRDVGPEQILDKSKTCLGFYRLPWQKDQSCDWERQHLVFRLP